MKNYIQPGEIIPIVAPSGGFTKGVPKQIGALLVVPTSTALVGVVTNCITRGVIEATKVGSQAWTVGARVYWDAGNSRFTTVAAAHFAAGVAVEAVGSGSGETTGVVRLDGVSRTDEDT